MWYSTDNQDGRLAGRMQESARATRRAVPRLQQEPFQDASSMAAAAAVLPFAVDSCSVSAFHRGGKCRRLPALLMVRQQSLCPLVPPLPICNHIPPSAYIYEKTLPTAHKLWPSLSRLRQTWEHRLWVPAETSKARKGRGRKGGGRLAGWPVLGDEHSTAQQQGQPSLQPPSAPRPAAQRKGKGHVRGRTTRRGADIRRKAPPLPLFLFLPHSALFFAVIGKVSGCGALVQFGTLAVPPHFLA